MTKFRHCTFPYILKISGKTFICVKSYWQILFFVFSKEIADCSSIRLAPLLLKNCKNLLKFGLNFFEIFWTRQFGLVVRDPTVTRRVTGSNPVRDEVSKFPDWTKGEIGPFLIWLVSPWILIFQQIFFARFHYSMVPKEWLQFIENWEFWKKFMVYIKTKD